MPREIKTDRVLRWLEELNAAGADPVRALVALNAVRDDPNATPSEHEAFYHALAQQALVWYLNITHGRRFRAEELSALREAHRRDRGSTP